MAWLRLTLELVTPCFIAGSAGSDSKANDLIDEGLRPPSLIGQWRYWLRVALAATRPNWRQREEELFGSQHEGGRQGRVWVRPGRARNLQVVPVGSNMAALGATNYSLFEPEDENGRSLPPIDPLLYLLGQGLSSFKSGLTRPALRAGQQVEVEVSVRRSPDLRADWADLRTALWLWQTFGGLGARSRRGWGSLQIVELGGREALPDGERQEWEAWFLSLAQDSWGEEARERALMRLLHLAEQGGQPERLRPPLAFTGDGTNPATATAVARQGEAAFSHLGCCCAVLPLAEESHTSWAAALADVGMALLSIRSNAHGRADSDDLLRRRDHDRVYGLLYDQEEMTEGPYRAAFGLPHNYYFAKRGDRPTRQTEFQGPPREDRRASPVLFHVARVRDESGKGTLFVPFVLWLKARLVSDRIHRSRSSASYQPPDWSAVVAFLREFWRGTQHSDGGIVPLGDVLS